jgi:tetratricopeptide (TPR) repeat protein
MWRPAVLFLISWVAWAGEGESQFQACEFKAAAHIFERALAGSPGDARLHFWAGRSYARMAEVASLLSAPKDARKARIHLEAAVNLEPANRQYIEELFDFYIDSPQWFDGGLSRAAILLEQLGPDDGGPGTPSKRLADARKELKRAAWHLEQGILRLGAVIGRAGAVK